MKLISSKSLKSSFAYTWWIYLVTPALLGGLLYWSYVIYHKPTVYEKVSIFVGGELTDDSLGNKLKDKVNEESLKEVSIHAVLPSYARYEESLSVVGLNNCDLLILPASSMNLIEDMKNYFVVIDEALYNPSFSYYEQNETKYAYDISSSWLKDDYIKYEESSYYLCLNVASRNIGTHYDQDNVKNDHALKVCKTILEGI